MSSVLHVIVEPGFFHSSAVGSALVIGAVVSVVAGAVGVFTVIRGYAFAGEALGDIGSAGGSAAYLVSASPIWGFVGLSLVGSGLISAAGTRSSRGRDIDTGIVVGGGLGLAALFLYLDTNHSNTTGAARTILFGSIFTVPAHTVTIVAVLGAATLLALLALYRVLLLATLSPDLAAARGLPVRLIGVAYLGLLAMAISLSAITIGSILSTALLIGPPAAALRLTNRPSIAIGLATAIGVVTTWVGLLLAYDSFDWPHSHGWPPSFLIVLAIFVAYLSARIFGRPTRRSALG